MSNSELIFENQRLGPDSLGINNMNGKVQAESLKQNQNAFKELARGVNHQTSPAKKSDFTNLQRNNKNKQSGSSVSPAAGVAGMQSEMNPHQLLAKNSKDLKGVKGSQAAPMDVKDLGVVSGGGKENNGKRSRQGTGGGAGSLNQLDASDSQILIGGPTKEDSFQKLYSKELDLDEDEVPIILHELNDSAIHFISHEQYERALSLLQKAQTLLDRLKFQKNPKDRFLIQVTMHNMALCFQKMGALEECALCLDACLHQINSQYLAPHFTKKPTKKLKKLKYECKIHMQVCALLSQLHRHEEALLHAKQAVQISQYLLNDLGHLCELNVLKTIQAKRREQEVHEEQERARNDENQSTGQNSSQADLIYYDHQISMLERTALRVYPIIREIQKRMVKHKDLASLAGTTTGSASGNTTATTTAGAGGVGNKNSHHESDKNQNVSESNKKGGKVFTKPSDLKVQMSTAERASFQQMVDSQMPNMKVLLGYLNQSEWLYLLNIGNIMQITPLTIHDLYSNQKIDVELARDSVLEKITFLAISYFCVSTELRFLVSSKEKLSFDPVYVKSESEFWHGKALEISCGFLPSESPLVTHILSSYQKHHAPVQQAIPENEEAAHSLKVIRPEKGIDKSQFQPIIRLNKNLNIALSPLRLSPNRYSDFQNLQSKRDKESLKLGTSIEGKAAVNQVSAGFTGSLHGKSSMKAQLTGGTSSSPLDAEKRRNLRQNQTNQKGQPAAGPSPNGNEISRIVPTKRSIEMSEAVEEMMFTNGGDVDIAKNANDSVLEGESGLDIIECEMNSFDTQVGNKQQWQQVARGGKQEKASQNQNQNTSISRSSHAPTTSNNLQTTNQTQNLSKQQKIQPSKSGGIVSRSGAGSGSEVVGSEGSKKVIDNEVDKAAVQMKEQNMARPKDQQQLRPLPTDKAQNNKFETSTHQTSSTPVRKTSQPVGGGTTSVDHLQQIQQQLPPTNPSNKTAQMAVPSPQTHKSRGAEKSDLNSDSRPPLGSSLDRIPPNPNPNPISNAHLQDQQDNLARFKGSTLSSQQMQQQVASGGVQGYMTAQPSQHNSLKSGKETTSGLHHQNTALTTNQVADKGLSSTGGDQSQKGARSIGQQRKTGDKEKQFISQQQSAHQQIPKKPTARPLSEKEEVVAQGSRQSRNKKVGAFTDQVGPKGFETEQVSSKQNLIETLHPHQTDHHNHNLLGSSLGQQQQRSRSKGKLSSKRKGLQTQPQTAQTSANVTAIDPIRQAMRSGGGNNQKGRVGADSSHFEDEKVGLISSNNNASSTSMSNLQHSHDRMLISDKSNLLQHSNTTNTANNTSTTHGKAYQTQHNNGLGYSSYSQKNSGRILNTSSGERELMQRPPSSTGMLHQKTHQSSSQTLQQDQVQQKRPDSRRMISGKRRRQVKNGPNEASNPNVGGPSSSSSSKNHHSEMATRASSAGRRHNHHNHHGHAGQTTLPHQNQLHSSHHHHSNNNNNHHNGRGAQLGQQQQQQFRTSTGTGQIGSTTSSSNGGGLISGGPASSSHVQLSLGSNKQQQHLNSASFKTFGAPAANSQQQVRKAMTAHTTHASNSPSHHKHGGGMLGHPPPNPGVSQRTNPPSGKLAIDNLFVNNSNSLNQSRSTIENNTNMTGVGVGVISGGQTRTSNLVDRSMNEQLLMKNNSSFEVSAGRSRSYVKGNLSQQNSRDVIIGSKKKASAQGPPKAQIPTANKRGHTEMQNFLTSGGVGLGGPSSNHQGAGSIEDLKKQMLVKQALENQNNSLLSSSEQHQSTSKSYLKKSQTSSQQKKNQSGGGHQGGGASRAHTAFGKTASSSGQQVFGGSSSQPGGVSLVGNQAASSSQIPLHINLAEDSFTKNVQQQMLRKKTPTVGKERQRMGQGDVNQKNQNVLLDQKTLSLLQNTIVGQQGVLISSSGSAIATATGGNTNPKSQSAQSLSASGGHNQQKTQQKSQQLIYNQILNGIPPSANHQQAAAISQQHVISSQNGPNSAQNVVGGSNATNSSSGQNQQVQHTHNMIKKFLKERQVGGSSQQNKANFDSQGARSSVSPHGAAQSSSAVLLTNAQQSQSSSGVNTTIGSSHPQQNTLIDNFTRNSPVLAQSNSQHQVVSSSNIANSLQTTGASRHNHNQGIVSGSLISSVQQRSSVGLKQNMPAPDRSSSQNSAGTGKAYYTAVGGQAQSLVGVNQSVALRKAAHDRFGEKSSGPGQREPTPIHPADHMKGHGAGKSSNHPDSLGGYPGASSGSGGGSGGGKGQNSVNNKANNSSKQSSIKSAFISLKDSRK